MTGLGSRQGEAYLTKRGSEVGYEPRGGDPLALGGPWSGNSREWLERSWNEAYPDAAFQLLDQFRRPRSGDLLVVAREGYDFRKRYELPEHKFGHGSLTRVHMQTPVWSSQPLPSIPFRTVDLFPSMLQWLDVTIPQGIDGELLWQPRERTRPLDRATATLVE